MAVRYQAIGALNAGEGSRAVLGLEIRDDTRASPVVLVLVPDSVSNDRQLLAEIRAEVEHAAKLDHPHIVRVLGFASVAEGQARVVEYADGEPLRRVLSTVGKLPAPMATRIVSDACLGTHYAHVAGNDDGDPFVHGDLRPETLMVTYAGITKVTGFGALAFAPRETGGQRVRGRRVHSAPEQVLGGRSAITVTTDVYLLGVTLYETLTGVAPWADHDEGFDDAVLNQPLPRAAPELIAPALMAVLDKACAKKAAQRYPTPYAMHEALVEAMGPQMATQEALGAYLTGTFPEAATIRAQRKSIVDAGIAEYMRKQWARKSFAVLQPVGAPAPQPGTAAPRPRPSPPSPTPAKAFELNIVNQPPVTKVPIGAVAIVGLTLLAVAGLTIGLLTREGPAKKLPPTRPPQVAVVVDAGVMPSPEVPLAAVPVPAVEPVAPPTPTPVPAPEAPQTVAIDSSPDVDVSIDDKPVGHTPWAGQLAPGRKVLKLTNKALGLSATKVITVGTEAVDIDYTFEKGSITVVAPEESRVYVDGAWVGTSPIRGEVPVWEGKHQLLVQLGQSKWQQTFTVAPNQRLNFNVKLQQ